MVHRPRWRAPLGKGPKNPVQSAAFIAKRGTGTSQCQATARTTGKRCRRIAMRGATRCISHHGFNDAVEAETKRFGPIIIIRKTRKRALAKLGLEPWPEGLETRADWLDLGPVARGRLFEAYANRTTDTVTWKHEQRKRPFRKKSLYVRKENRRRDP